MTRVHWVIQENQGDSHGVRAILDALESDGHVAHLVSLQGNSGVPPIPDLPDGAPVVCHGPGFVTRALNHPHLASGLFFDPATFRWSAFQSDWKVAMLSLDGRVMPLSAVRDLLRNGMAAFSRPDSDTKAFEGGIYTASRLAETTEHVSVSDAMPVVVASPIDIQAEWRFFIVDKRVVGCSEYRRWGHVSTQGSVPHRAIDLAAELAKIWSPADIFCVDLATTGDRIGVVEANCFNASRFYAADIERVLRAVNIHVSAKI